MKFCMVYIIINLLLIFINTNQCHYSCESCLPQTLYTFCIKCKNTESNITFNDPTVLQQQFRQSSYKTHICTGFVNPTTQVNVLGVFLLVICVIICSITRSPKMIYIVLTLQTFSLFSFLEVAYLQPLQYLLSSLQYLMIFNIMGAQGKLTGDHQFTISNFYKLQQYYLSSQFTQNIIGVGIINLIAFIALLVMFIIRSNKNKDQHLNQENRRENDLNIVPQESGQRINNEPQQSNQIIKDQTLSKIQIIFMTIFLFLIQQTVLTILVGARIRNSKSSFIPVLVIGLIYLCMLTYVIVRSHFLKLPYFQTNQIMFMNFTKKIVFPVFLITPILFHFILFIFMIIEFFIELYFQIKGKRFTNCRRWKLYKIGEFVIILFALIYYIVERINSQETIVIMRLVFAILIAVGCASIIIQGPFSIYETFIQEDASAVQNSDKVDFQSQKSQKNKNMFDTKENLKHTQNEDQKNNELLYDPPQQLNQTKIEKNSKNENNSQNSNSSKNGQPGPYVMKLQLFQSDNDDSNQLPHDKNINGLKISYNKNEKKNNEEQQGNTNNKPQKKRKFKDLIDKQLRLRYGIK